MVIRPATSRRSDCRGENRIASAPNLAISERDASTAINSIPQQAVPNGIGQSEFLRPQLTAASTVVVRILDFVSLINPNLKLLFSRQTRVRREELT